MSISIREAKASQQDRNWIEQAYGEYLADLAVDQTGVFPSLTVTGQSIAELVQGWFRDERSVPFVILREISWRDLRWYSARQLPPTIASVTIA